MLPNKNISNYTKCLFCVLFAPTLQCVGAENGGAQSSAGKHTRRRGDAHLPRCKRSGAKPRETHRGRAAEPNANKTRDQTRKRGTETRKTRQKRARAQAERAELRAFIT